MRCATYGIVFCITYQLWCGQLLAQEFSIDPASSFLRVIPGVPLEDPSSRIEIGSFLLNSIALIEQLPGSLETGVSGSVSTQDIDEMVLITGDLVGIQNDSGEFQPSSIDPTLVSNFGAQDDLLGNIKLVIRDFTIGFEGEINDGEPADFEFRLSGGVIDFILLGQEGSLPLVEVENSGSEELLRFPNTSSESVAISPTELIVPISFDIPIEVLNPGDTRIAVEGQIVASRSSPDTIFGDLNDDRMLGLADIDLLTGAISDTDPNKSFDLNGDGEIDLGDISRWLDEFGTVLGDTDLDRTVAFHDFLALSSNFGADGTWSDGNFDGDAIVGFSDFLAISSNFGFSSSLSSSVPEPHHRSHSSALILMLTLASFRCRRRTLRG